VLVLVGRLVLVLVAVLVLVLVDVLMLVLVGVFVFVMQDAEKNQSKSTMLAINLDNRSIQ
jgi:hypothetical protein